MCSTQVLCTWFIVSSQLNKCQLLSIALLLLMGLQLPFLNLRSTQVLKLGFFSLFLTEVQLIYSVSGVQQSDSFIYIFISLQVIIRYGIQFPVLYTRSLLLIYFIYSSVYLLIPNSQFILPLSLLVTISLFSMSVSLFLF